MPRAPIEPPADLLIASAQNTIRDGVESGAADELTGLEDLKCPEPKTLLIEAFIDAVDELVTFSTIQRGREVAHDFGIGVQGREGRPVAVAPTRSTMKVGKNWQVREVTAQDWTQVGAALGLDPDEALERVERFRQGLPDALADAAATAPGPFLKDAQRFAKAFARQGHRRAVRLPRASHSQRR